MAENAAGREEKRSCEDERREEEFHALLRLERLAFLEDDGRVGKGGDCDKEERREGGRDGRELISSISAEEGS